jgi:hypothetical protein
MDVKDLDRYALSGDQIFGLVDLGTASVRDLPYGPITLYAFYQTHFT